MSAYFSAESILAEFAAGDVTDMDALYADIYQRVWRTQSADARQLLDALRLAPVNGISETLLQAYTQFGKARLWRTIRDLVDASLLIRQSRDGTMHYHIHSLTDSFLRSRDHQQQRSPAAQAWYGEQILAACRYWQTQIAQITPATFGEQHPLLYRLVREGLKKAQSWQAATHLMLNLLFTIENTPYWQQWLDLHYVALEGADSADPYTCYRLYSHLGIYHRLDNDVEKALYANRTALEIATQLNNLKLVGRQQVHLANSYCANGEFTQALELAQAGLEIFEALDLATPFHATALNELAISQFLLGNFSQATTFFEKAAQLKYDNPSKNTTLARIYIGWGSALRFQGNFQAAEKKYALARQITAKTQGYKDQIMVAFYSCHNFLDQALLDSAEKYIQDPTYAYHNLTLPVREAGYIAFSFGRYYFKRKQMEKTVIHLKATLKLWENCRQFFSMGEVYALLAQALKAMSGSQAEADNHAQKARIIFDTVCLGGWLTIAQQQYPFLYADTKQ
ncbi:MAG TPA: tetratricopeptide repeat protein [Gammaproteobacteria bacterium]|nr:tetratricopeptide repeat protein [Gammaproteobacteria bacterium]